MKLNLLFGIIFLSLIIYANIDHEHGYIGVTKRDGGLGCQCHGVTPIDSVIVWIEGPDSVFIGDSAQYKILITGGPAVAGGFDLASYFGVLDSTDTLTHIISGELTHSDPNPFANDTVEWNFLYLAPDSVVIDTLYSVGNSTNSDGNPQPGDQWNFGNNFVIYVLDLPVNSEKENQLPDQFVLYQNYPNPFNPSTKIQYSINSTQQVKLIVYDLLGREVVTLVNEEKSPGEYEVEFNANGMTSGVYFYRLEVIPHNHSIIETRKMVLLR